MLSPFALVPSLLHPCCLETRVFSKTTSSSSFLLLFSSLLFSLPSVSSRAPLLWLWDILSITPFLHSPLSSSRRRRACRARRERKGEELLPPSTCQTAIVSFLLSCAFLSPPRTPQAHSCTSVASPNAYPCVLLCPDVADLCCGDPNRKATATVLRTLLSALFPPLLLCSAPSLIVNSHVSTVLLHACTLTLYALA